jgi:hypothetical protein
MATLDKAEVSGATDQQSMGLLSRPTAEPLIGCAL